MKQKIFYNAGTDDSSGSDSETDNTKLFVSDTVYVSQDGGTTNEAFPKPNVEYDFCVDVLNTSNRTSGPFYVHFTLSGDQNPSFEKDFKQDAGLDAHQSVKANVHFGSFPNEFKDYFLEACVYSVFAPSSPINCAGTFEFAVNTASDISDSANGSSPTNSGNTDDTSLSNNSGTNDSNSSDDNGSSNNSSFDTLSPTDDSNADDSPLSSNH